MKKKVNLSILCSLILVLACGEMYASGRKAINAASGLTGIKSQPTAGEKAAAKNYACTLLSNSDVQRVQGEAVKEVKTSDRIEGSLLISHCFYLLPTFHKSVSFEVTRGDPNKGVGRGARERWNEAFHRDRDREEKEKEASKPTPVLGIGDEAFWTGNRINGAFYVLKKNIYLRISIGGPEDETMKIKKAKALAQRALARL
jgi:hypothetical protein